MRAVGNDRADGRSPAHVRAAWLHFARTLPPRGGWEPANMSLALQLAEMAVAELGSRTEVDHAFYQRFAELDDASMAELVAALTRGLEPAFDALAEAGAGADAAPHLLTASLHLVARGFVVITEEPRQLVFAMPSGPEPTPEMEARLAARIEGAEPLIRASVHIWVPPVCGGSG